MGLILEMLPPFGGGVLLIQPDIGFTVLVHSYSRELKGRDVWLQRTVVRDERFRVAVLTSRGLATDFGVTMEVVSSQSLARRSQLSIVLSGRGYFQSGEKTMTLEPGDVVESDQAQQEAEGYAGSPSEVLILEWEPEHLFAPFRTGPARLSRVGASDVEALRGLLGDVARPSAESWILALRERLAALGLRTGASSADLELSPSRAPMLDCYAALGGALSQLEAQPTLTELAGTLGLSERQAHRRVADLIREFGLPFDGWRAFVNESRLEWALQALSVAGVTVGQAARLSGYRSTIALHHALSLRGARTPSAIARTLAERWR